MPLGEHRYAWMYVFGFARLASGQARWWLLGGVNTPAMGAVLAEFAQGVGAGKNKRVILGLRRKSRLSQAAFADARLQLGVITFFMQRSVKTWSSTTPASTPFTAR